MTATEAMDPTTNEPKLVEFADKNGDGVVDAVDPTTGLSQETFDPNGTSILTYHDADQIAAGSGMVDWDATGAPETLGGLAMNEDFVADPNNPFGGDWVAAAGFGAAGAAPGTPPTPAIDPITGLPQDPATGTPTDGTLVTWNGAATLSRSTGAPGATPPAAGATTPMYTPNGDGTYTVQMVEHML